MACILAIALKEEKAYTKLQAGYHLEPTGLDAVSENGKIECLNDTFASMVRYILYIAALPV